MDATTLNQPTVTQSWEPNTISPKEKWKQRNDESRKRQRRRREEIAKKDDNTGNRPINDNGIDAVPRNPFPPVASIDFNGTVAICINGTPYYIDIEYDDSAGAYAVTNDPNFPIEP